MGSEVPLTHYELTKMSFLEHHKHISEVAGLCICSNNSPNLPILQLKATERQLSCFQTKTPTLRRLAGACEYLYTHLLPLPLGNSRVV